MLEILIALTNCYVVNCKKEFKKRKEIRAKWFEETNKLDEDYKNKVITRKQYILKLNKLDDKYFNAIENINLHKCEINKCYNQVKNHLDYLSDKNKLQKKFKYTTDDYVKILQTNRKNFRKLPQ